MTHFRRAVSEGGLLLNMKRMVQTTTVSELKFEHIVMEKVFVTVAFCVLYLTLISALPFNSAYYAVLPIGAVVALVSSLFFNKKYSKYVILGGALIFTALCFSGFTSLKNGWFGFFNGAISNINSTRHTGYASFEADGGFASSFLFAMQIAVWFAVFCAFAVKKPYVYICVSAVIFLILLFVGLYPHYLTAIALIIVYVGLLALKNGFNLKSLCCYLICTAVVSLATLPCYFFAGSGGVDKFRENIKTSFENSLYGTSLPNGRLANSYGMKGSDKVRLEVTLSRLTPELYLKGFVGSEFDGSKWLPTDRNAYVENGYQGLIDYISDGGLPLMQYAEYSNLSKSNNNYSVTVKNVSADRRYVYAPYTLSTYSTGSAYYDLGLHGKVFGPKTYSYTVFAQDQSSERVTQAQWVMENANRTEDMSKYLALEGQYRAFVYDTYLDLDTQTQNTVQSIVGDFETDSINTATQFIRAYFLDAYTYSDKCDRIGGDFLNEFFGGKIKNANASYFATAATCMFRTLGFPARYVEGYAVQADVSEAEIETITVQVTGGSTHAWTEVYFDGIGWLPIEVTPTFFTEQPPDVTIDPTNPDISGTVPSNPEQGEIETPDGEENETPEPPPVTPVVPVIPVESKSALLNTLKVLVPVLAVIAGLIAIILAFVLRRYLVCIKRRKMLNADGAEFGRTAYRIMERDCKYFGGFDSAMLEKLGVPERGTARFIRIAEQCVFGRHKLNESERAFMLWYIKTAQSALLKNCNFFRSLYYKFVKCIVI